jgi:hypothetical protein
MSVVFSVSRPCTTLRTKSMSSGSSSERSRLEDSRLKMRR